MQRSQRQLPWPQLKSMVEAMAGRNKFGSFKRGFEEASYPKENMDPNGINVFVGTARLFISPRSYWMQRITVLNEIVRCHEILATWWPEWSRVLNSDHLAVLERGLVHMKLFERLAYMMGYMIGFTRPEMFIFEDAKLEPISTRPTADSSFFGTTDSDDSLLPSLSSSPNPDFAASGRRCRRRQQ